MVPSHSCNDEILKILADSHCRTSRTQTPTELIRGLHHLEWDPETQNIMSVFQGGEVKLNTNC